MTHIFLYVLGVTVGVGLGGIAFGWPLVGLALLGVAYLLCLAHNYSVRGLDARRQP